MTAHANRTSIASVVSNGTHHGVSTGPTIPPAALPALHHRTPTAPKGLFFRCRRLPCSVPTPPIPNKEYFVPNKEYFVTNWHYEEDEAWSLWRVSGAGAGCGYPIYSGIECLYPLVLAEETDGGRGRRDTFSSRSRDLATAVARCILIDMERGRGQRQEHSTVQEEDDRGQDIHDCLILHRITIPEIYSSKSKPQ